MNCIYCTNKINKSSLEHIVPDALGGSLLDSRFKTRRVCERCNNLLGLYADGLYIKSFFSLSNKWLSINKEVLKTKPTNYPLLYFGYLDIDNKMGFEHCELWISPCKGRIFHFHNNKDEGYYSYAGGNPISRKKTPSLALFVSTTTKQELLILGLNSFYKHFQKVERVVSHIEFKEGIPTKLGRYPNNFESTWTNWYHEKIEKGCNNKHKCNFSIQLGYADRMLAKIALGLGGNLFGEPFLKSDYSRMLRDYMWQQDSDAREKIGILRYDTFARKEHIFSVLNLPNKDVTIFVTLHSIGVMLTVNIFGDEQSIAITTDAGLMDKFSKEFDNGFVYTTSPMYDKSSGPYEFMEYIALQQQANYS